MTTQERWQVVNNGILWDVTQNAQLPHEDHFEMSGRKISVIVRYRVDVDCRLSLACEVIWPTLRTKEGDVRGYLRRIYDPLPVPVLANGTLWTTDSFHSIRFDGSPMFLFQEKIEEDKGRIAALRLDVVDQELKVYLWAMADENVPLTMAVATEETVETDSGVYGEYRIVTLWQAYPNRVQQFTGTIGAYRADQPEVEAYARRNHFHFPRLEWTDEIQQRTLILETPDEAIDVAFAFAKIRAAESLFDTKMGLVHSPGGGRYYGGIWNNDQCEYSGPLFGYLGDPDAFTAALTAYRNFAVSMGPDYAPIPTSLEMEGTIPIHAGGDRGDAAMYASGAARFALASGDPKIAQELYTPIAWCLEYCRRKTNAAGVVESDCDELEHRFPAGDANLSTACLYYDGLRRMADLANALGRHEEAVEYAARATTLAAAIEAHFGATVEGFQTYRYYDGNTTLRAWICLPLVFLGANNESRVNNTRVAGTLDALFSPQLWGPDGLATEAGKPDFWDRSTLYALRGAFVVGDTERAFAHFSAYTRRRLLGDHVPYPVEAYPEGNQAHLSAESALYCRVVTEGLFGLLPTSLTTFTVTPRLPAHWNEMALRRVPICGQVVDIEVTRDGVTITPSIS